jgi:CubicO group peptidase (beta-lactamase class C family)
MVYMHAHYFFDGVVLAAKNDKLIYNKSFGLANRELKIKNSEETQFRLGSVSKQFIGFIIIKLAEEGELKFEDPISKYIKKFDAPDKKNITVNNLLSHSSGISNYTSMKNFNSTVYYPADSLINMMVSAELNFKPGTNYSYSNSNFYLLCIIAEKATGKKFEEILKEKILIPAKMNDSGIEHSNMVPSNEALPYVNSDSGFVNAEYIQMDNVAAGMYSTAIDLLRWSLFLQNELQNNAFFKKTLRPFILADGTQSVYFGGLCILPDQIMHQGHINGFADQISVDTVNHFTIILLTNNDFKQLFVTSRTILSILKEERNALKWISSNWEDYELKKYEGEYVLNNDTVINKVSNGTLISTYKGQSLPWHQASEGNFFCEYFEGNLWAETNESGEISGVVSFEDYFLYSWKKIK